VNRALPQRDRRDRGSNPRWAPGSPGSLPGPIRLVGRVAATASPTRNRHCCATVGPRAFGGRACQSMFRGCAASGKARHVSAGRARKEGGVRCYLLMR
jgi:hypothetical protein